MATVTEPSKPAAVLLAIRPETGEPIHGAMSTGDSDEWITFSGWIELMAAITTARGDDAARQPTA
jgi:hypothetical protein